MSMQIFSNLHCSRLLDIGCGDGELTVSLADACDAEEVHGVDISDSGVKSAAMRGVNAVRLDIDRQDLPYKPNTFDAIYSGEVLSYVTDPDHFLEETHRCLSKESIFVLTVPNLSAIHNRIALLLGKLPYPMRAATDVLTEDTHQTALSERRSLYPYKTLYEHIESHGFDVRRAYGSTVLTGRSNVLVGLFDGIAAKFPSLSYRNVFVCEKPA